MQTRAIDTRLDPPGISVSRAVSAARDLYGVDASARQLPSERDQNFELRTGAGERYVLKVSHASEDPQIIDCQNHVLERLAVARTGFAFPSIVRDRAGRGTSWLDEADGTRHMIRLCRYVPGTPLANVAERTPALLEELGTMLGRVDRALEGFSHAGAERAFRWDLRVARTVVDQHIDAITDREKRALLDRVLSCIDQYGTPLLPSLRLGVIHNDANDHNVLVSCADDDGANAAPRIAGLIDFGDMVYSYIVSEVAIASAYAMMGASDPLTVAEHVVRGYDAAYPLGEAEVASLMPLICLRLCTSVVLAAHQRGQQPGNAYLSISERPAWTLLEQLADVHPDAARDRFARAVADHPDDGRRRMSTEGLLAARRAHIGPSLSISYRRPLTIVRGWMQHLYDADGREYLDMVNNVAHVGHCHPRVVEALSAQAGVLNTNTRYLHESLVRYAERLTRLLPDPLRVCYFVCSGSEANELALRLARTHTGRRDVVVIDHAYHGNTTSLIELSPYKFNGPRGAGAPPHVHVVPMPDPYRGPHRGRGAESGRRYATHVRETVERLDREGHPVAAFFAEPLLGCGGQIEPPDRYLAEAFAHVRAAGGVCVADEVQVGFGRVGTHRWGFETQGAVPDIVTMGKPIGNGHPLGAVVTTPEIAASFANGMEYFNTFGGNPVSCAVGLAVLDVLEEEGLQERARSVGQRLANGLRALAARHATIGDVRGRGLFLGIELVLDRETLAPAPRLAADVVESMRDRGILLSTDGPLHNVIKIKPPLVFSDADADRMVETLDDVLRQSSPGPRRPPGRP
jgi:4-aminobutyrate aminotransferase-like enzyme/Ser/Thr protein kinase RdoA (MazF antagonist)